MFKFRSGTHGLNEELRRQRGKNGKTECILCSAECESAAHVLWECPAYTDSRDPFMVKIRDLLGKSLKALLRDLLLIHACRL